MKKLGVLLFGLLLACGKRGDPRPPVPVIPQATTDLVVTQRGATVLLTWSYPSLTTAGQGLRNLSRVVVYRVTEELPVPQAGRDPNTILPGDIDPTTPRAVALFARLPTLSANQFTKLRNRLDSIEGSSLPAATAGARLVYQDTPPFQTPDGRPVRLTYAVVTETLTAHADLSNLISIVPLTVPTPPVSFRATAKPEGIVLDWSKPEWSGSEAARPFLAGYNVYRYPAAQQPDALAAPINATPIKATTFTDVPTYGNWSYVVRALSAAGPPRIESDPSASVTASFKDLLPPPAPASLNALVETKQVRLVWDPVSVPDLAGYVLYRHEYEVRLKLTPFLWPETFFHDISAAPGITYYYTVTAMDKSGNESAPTRSETIVIPRAP